MCAFLVHVRVKSMRSVGGLLYFSVGSFESDFELINETLTALKQGFGDDIELGFCI